MSAFLEAINLQRDNRIGDQRDHKARSIVVTLFAFGLVGSVFFYFVSWFSEVKRDRSAEVVQTAAIIVLKKLPPAVGNEMVSLFSNKGIEYQRARRSEANALMRDGQPAFDSLEKPIVIRKSLLSLDDNQILSETSRLDSQIDRANYSEMPAVEKRNFGPAPEEPDPASLIDYVLQKRRLSL